MTVMEPVVSSFWWVMHWVSYRTNRVEHEGHCVCKGSGVLARRPWQARTGRRILCQQIYQAPARSPRL